MNINFKNFFNSKKAVAILFFVIIFLTTNTPRAHAQMAVYDPLNWAENSITSAMSAITGGSAPVTATASVTNAATNVAQLSWTAVGKNLLDYAAYSAAQKLLNQLTQNTIKWIQGGFHGSPSFAVDTHAIVSQVGDEIAGKLVHDIRNVAVCNFTATYKDDLTKTVTMDSKVYPYVYKQQAKCPFQETYNFKASDFYNDFSRGGWNAFASALQDGGNPYGLNVLTAQEKASREATALATKNQKLSWSNGFTDVIDTTNCSWPSDYWYVIGDPDPDLDFSASGGSDTPLIETQARVDQLNQQLMSDSSFAADQAEYCKTTTPGKIVGDQLTKSLGVDMDRLGFADNMNKIIAAFLDTLTQNAVRGVFGTGDSYKSVGITTGYTSGGTSTTTPGGVYVPTPGTGTISTGAVTVSASGAPVATVITGIAEPGQVTATIHGSVQYLGYDPYVNVSFRWGTSTTTLSYLGQEQSPLPKQNVAPFHGVYSAVTFQDFQATLNNLTPGTTYYYQATVQTSPYVISTSTDPTPTLGNILSFTTTP